MRITGSCFITAGTAALPGLTDGNPVPLPGDHISLINLLMCFSESREQGWALSFCGTEFGICVLLLALLFPTAPAAFQGIKPGKIRSGGVPAAQRALSQEFSTPRAQGQLQLAQWMRMRMDGWMRMLHTHPAWLWTFRGSRGSHQRSHQHLNY